MFRQVAHVKTVNLTVPPGHRVVFISDVHLGFGSKAQNDKREDRLLQLLANLDSCVHLVIVGDLFDYWFDYRFVIPSAFVRTLAALHHLARSGVQITYLMGNHDFGHYRYFRQELNIPVEQADIDLHLNDTRIYVCHGDGKAANDTGYLILRAILRNRCIQSLYRMIHPSVGIWLASRTSHGSRAYTDKKEYGPDGLRAFAEQKIVSEGYSCVVMGHRHKAEVRRIASGTYVNLGDWLGTDSPYAEWTPEAGIILHSNDIPTSLSGT
ncbi:MAG: UDP-2,3-diacylglucosamine diphosphatase [Chlorobi bacterium]|nr:MAG: UDP-2,3-diacylglucosamine diphosphatase [Bacteroidota bacterium]KXK35768.1 MAG: UDP-2,3-diacylglucosamine hydrolase [Chlorobi bacterium OLB6]MBE2265268.1 UDP-2,3-diacylglucosamine diphosphatase [Flavobacteriales bacterium]MBL1160269.1 UDP-2,3-diacylglucosamine diphosphatase [Chlorobiota bacterium]MBW7853407.1 UDP-2,3-diacylglucosamine diphosphatase [Candidatus Kapabacteria bacterium]MCC6330454.1 UDP-2,3-diacylglucosamine diphosphatase [Ignavibacteria bacterium]